MIPTDVETQITGFGLVQFDVPSEPRTLVWFADLHESSVRKVQFVCRFETLGLVFVKILEVRLGSRPNLTEPNTKFLGSDDQEKS